MTKLMADKKIIFSYQYNRQYISFSFLCNFFLSRHLFVFLIQQCNTNIYNQRRQSRKHTGNQITTSKIKKQNKPEHQHNGISQIIRQNLSQLFKEIHYYLLFFFFLCIHYITKIFDIKIKNTTILFVAFFTTFLNTNLYKII